ncbi:MAG: hypothetical protein WCA10_20965 [Terracidiphilus sp.]
MSLIKKADVKNHLSARHRSEIHLARPVGQSDATDFAHEDPASEDPKGNESVENPLNISTPNKPDTTPIVISKSVKA